MNISFVCDGPLVANIWSNYHDIRIMNPGLLLEWESFHCCNRSMLGLMPVVLSSPSCLGSHGRLILPDHTAVTITMHELPRDDGPVENTM